MNQQRPKSNKGKCTRESYVQRTSDTSNMIRPKQYIHQSQHSEDTKYKIHTASYKDQRIGWTKLECNSEARTNGMRQQFTKKSKSWKDAKVRSEKFTKTNLKSSAKVQVKWSWCQRIRIHDSVLSKIKFVYLKKSQSKRGKFLPYQSSKNRTFENQGRE